MILLAFFIWCILFAICVFNRYITNKYAHIVYAFVFLLLFSFAGFREVGIDHDSLAYKNYYESERIIWLIAEPTFGIISTFVSYVFKDFRFVLLIYALIGVYIKLKAFPRITSFVYWTILLYFSTYFLLHEFTQIRAGIASGIFLYAIPYLACRKLKIYTLFIIIACLFHYSALVLLPLVFISNKEISKYEKMFLFLIIPIAIILHYLHFNPIAEIPIETVRLKLEIYQKEQESSSTSLNIFNLVYIVKYIFLYVFLLFYKKVKHKAIYSSLLIRLYAISLFAYIVLSDNTILAMRISELIGIVEIVLIPYLIYIIKQKSFAFVIISVISLSYLVINIFSLELIYDKAITSYPL